MNRNVVMCCAAVLLAAVLGLAVADNVRPWKRYQLEFFAFERQQLESRLDAARTATAETLADLEGRIESQQALLVDRHDEIVELENDLRSFGGKSRGARLRRSRLESELAELLYDGEMTAGAELSEALRQTRMEIESLDELIADREGKLAAVRSEVGLARDNLARARAPIEDLEHRLAALPPPPMLPVGGLLASGVAVREVSLPALLGAGDPRPRVDRCVTCHLAAVGGDAENAGWPAPFSRHPAPELFLSTDSPHPYQRFGCTTCHGGEGRATDFSRAGHAPATSEQANRWQASQGWQGRNGPVMLPLDLTEAACGRCHGAEAARAPTLDHGRRLIAALGCTGCHLSPVSEGGGQAPRVGPSLVGIAGKTTPAWVHRWLEAPRDFRQTTRMPHVFDHRDEPERSAEIRAIVDYLWQVSRPPAAYEPPPAGEVETGRALFESVGCPGCHLLGLEAESAGSFERRHGPHLAGTGSKVSAGWLYAWLREPGAYRRDTPMPSLRLDEREAADLTAYLMTRRDPAWERLSLPVTDAETRDRLVLSALARGHTLEDSQAQLEAMSERNKNVYLGEQAVARHGCHGCHQIAGFEQAPAVGPTLSEVGHRLRYRLASRAPDIPARWRTSSHLPAYDLSDDEARAVTVALLASAADYPPAADERTAALVRGRQVMARYNCRGCHRIEGRGGLPARADLPGDVPPADVSPADAPPDLTYVGARLRAPWLHEYLTDPGGRQIRPWLDVRMPTFGLSVEENNALVRYFAALDDRPLFADEPRSPRAATDVAVGRVVFGMLQCGDCHRPASEESIMPQLAPAYDEASARLRPEWVVALILDPERWLPGTPMPANFLPQPSPAGASPDDPGELSSEFLIGSINTPIFSVERDRLLRLMGSEDQLHAYLSDPERVAAALRDYLWTLGK